jgi:hypothetical protein
MNWGARLGTGPPGAEVVEMLNEAYGGNSDPSPLSTRVIYTASQTFAIMKIVDAQI